VAHESDSKKNQSVHIFESDHGRYLGLIKNIFADNLRRAFPTRKKFKAYISSSQATGVIWDYQKYFCGFDANYTA